MSTAMRYRRFGRTELQMVCAKSKDEGWSLKKSLDRLPCGGQVEMAEQSFAFDRSNLGHG